MKPIQSGTNTERIEPRWQEIYRVGGAAALVMLGIMIAQVVIFVLWPPPTAVEGFFALFQKNWLLGLLSVDLLYLVNNTLLILIYLALYAALKPTHETQVSIALVLGLVGIASYFSSNTAFEMLSLSRAYAAAASEAQRAVLLGAGQAMVETYRGTAFDVYYVLNAIALLIFAGVMLRSRVFSRATAWVGLAAGILMSIPSTAGTLGLIFSLISLVPWGVFSVMVARRLFQLAARPRSA